jgi:UDP-glucose 4-epimerase
MSILVTGGAGYIGSATVEALRRRGEEVVVFDNLSAGHSAALDSSIKLEVGDFGDAARLGEVIQRYGVDRVIHFAAFTSVPESVGDPHKYFFNNYVNALNLIEVSRAQGVRQIVFSSTAAVFGEPEYSPLDEAHPKNPTNPYGLSKLMVEMTLAAYDRAHGVRHVALRYFNACGGSPERGEDHTPETHLIPLVLQVALGQRPAVHVYGDDYPTPDGTCVRDYIHVDDLAQAHLLALDYLKSGGESLQLNLGNGSGYSVREVIDVARRVTGHPIPEVVQPRRAGDPSELVAASEKAKRILGWTPEIPDLEAIIASAWEWHRTHPHGYEEQAR